LTTTDHATAVRVRQSESGNRKRSKRAGLCKLAKKVLLVRRTRGTYGTHFCYSGGGETRRYLSANEKRGPNLSDADYSGSSGKEDKNRAEGNMPRPQQKKRPQLRRFTKVGLGRRAI